MQADIWLYVVPNEMPLKEQMEVIVTHVLLPTVLSGRIEYMTAQVQRIDLSGSGAQSTALPQSPPAKPRIIITLDGEETHLQAMFTCVIDNGVAKAEGIEVIKFAASASKIQQPCDVSPCYRALKQEKKLPQSTTTAVYTPMLSACLAGIPPASQRTFITYLSHLPSMLSKCFHERNVKKGWEVSGLWPFNQEQILSQCRSWKLLSAKSARIIRAALPALTEYAFLHGEVDDDAMDAVLAGCVELRTIMQAVNGTQAESAEKPRKSKKMALRDQVINRRRVVWLNHSDVLERRRARHAAKMAALTQKQQGGKSKSSAAGATSQQQSSSTKASKNKRKAPPSAPRKKISAGGGPRCSNLACKSVMGSGSIDWDECSTCAASFCSSAVCLELLQIHETICNDE